MKKIFFLLFALSLTGTSYSQFPVSVDSVYTFIKYNSVHRNTVDWKKADKNFTACISAAKTVTDTMNCFVQVLKELNDVHSQIYLNNQYFGHYNPVDDSTAASIKPLREKAFAQTGKISTALLADKYAYIKVPSFNAYNPEQINRYGQSLLDSVCRFNPKKIKGFIIDLRLNTGGNMYPMLSGLSPILGDGVIGFEVDADDSVVRKWEIRDNNFIIGGHKATAIKNNCGAAYHKIAVIVLTGPMTASSGAMTAIAFKKRLNTYFIGEPTAEGYTSSNGYFMFAPTLYMNFATNFVADRERQVYRTAVNPDQAIYKGDNFDNLLADEKVKAALNWLTKKKSR